MSELETREPAGEAPVAPRSVLDVLGDAHRRGASGVVEVRTDGSPRRLTLVAGELYLPADHPLAERLRSPDGASPPELRGLMARIASLLSSWDGPARFVPGDPDAADLVGPLPTVALLMERAATVGTERLLERFGGERVRVEAVAAAGDRGEAEAEGGEAGTAPGVTRLLLPSAAALLARLSRPVALSDLLRQTAAEPAEVFADLARLVAGGLARTAEGGPPGAPAVAPGAVGPAGPADRSVAPDVLRRFADRIGRDLSSRPLALDAASHRSRVAELLERSDRWNAYELLAVPLDAGDAAIHEAFVRLARLVHPDHGPRLGLAGGESPLPRLFERATAAYLTLSQRERRRRYDERMAIVPDLRPTEPQREEEARRMAASYYERASALVEAEDFHFAVELLKQAVQTHARPEYYVLLGQVQARNPKWLRHAADSYRKAMDLGADDPRISVALGRICEEMGQGEEATRHYRAALARDADGTEARAGLARLGGDGTRPGNGLTGLFGRSRS